MKHIAKILAVGAVLAASAPFALASPVTLNVIGAGTYGTATGDMVSGTVTSVNATPGGATFTVSYSESVYRGGTSALCPTCLNFVYNFTNKTGDGTDFIESFSANDFGTIATSEDYILSGGVAPSSGTRNLGVINYLYDSPNVNPGFSTDTLVIASDAMFVKPGGMSFQDGSTAVAAGLAPSAVPEPSSLILMGTGLLSSAGMLLRSRRRAA